MRDRPLGPCEEEHTYVLHGIKRLALWAASVLFWSSLGLFPFVYQGLYALGGGYERKPWWFDAIFFLWVLGGNVIFYSILYHSLAGIM